MFTSFTLVLPGEHCSALQAISSKQVCFHSRTGLKNKVLHWHIGLMYKAKQVCITMEYKGFQTCLLVQLLMLNGNIFNLYSYFYFSLNFQLLFSKPQVIYSPLIRVIVAFYNPMFFQQWLSPQSLCFQILSSEVLIYHLEVHFSTGLYHII